MKKQQPTTTNKPFPWSYLRETTPDGNIKRYSDFTYRHQKNGDVNFITIKVDANVGLQINNDGGTWSEPYFVGWLTKKAEVVTDWSGVDET